MRRSRFSEDPIIGILKAHQAELSPAELCRKHGIYKEERLTVRKRGGRKRALGTRAPMAVPQDPNHWSLIMSR